MKFVFVYFGEREISVLYFVKNIIYYSEGDIVKIFENRGRLFLCFVGIVVLILTLWREIWFVYLFFCFCNFDVFGDIYNVVSRGLWFLFVCILFRRFFCNRW